MDHGSAKKDTLSFKEDTIIQISGYVVTAA